MVFFNMSRCVVTRASSFRSCWTSRLNSRWVGRNPDYTFIENSTNLGFAKGCNQGLKASQGQFLLLLNNDVLVTPNWLSGMMDCLRSNPKIGIVGPMTNEISGIQKIPAATYQSDEKVDEIARELRERNRNRRIPSRRIVGFCMLFRKELLDRVGFLDESFGTGNFEDDDFCLRAELAGYTNMIAGDVFIHHYGSRSFIGNQIDYRASMSGNRKIFFNPEMQIVAAVNGEGVRDKAMQVASDILQAHPDLSGVFGINDDSALHTRRGAAIQTQPARHYRL